MAAHNLPSAYQEVEYIESSGTQYFMLPPITGVPTSIEIDFIPYHWSGGYYEVYFGQAANNLRSDFLSSQYGGSSPNIAIFSSGIYYPKSLLDSRVVMYADQNTLKINDEEYENSGLQSWGNGEYFGICLSPFRGTYAGQYISKMRLYSAKMVSDGEDFYNLVPCYRIADGVAGMYDMVGGEFYTNAGSGEFLVGADVQPVVPRPEPILYPYNPCLVARRALMGKKGGGYDILTKIQISGYGFADIPYTIEMPAGVYLKAEILYTRRTNKFNTILKGTGTNYLYVQASQYGTTLYYNQFKTANNSGYSICAITNGTQTTSASSLACSFTASVGSTYDSTIEIGNIEFINGNDVVTLCPAKKNGVYGMAVLGTNIFAEFPSTIVVTELE